MNLGPGYGKAGGTYLTIDQGREYALHLWSGATNEDGEWVRTMIEGETMIVMDRIGRILQEAGGSYYNLASVNGYQGDMDDWPAMDETYKKVFPDGKYPARTVVPALLISG